MQDPNEGTERAVTDAQLGEETTPETAPGDTGEAGSPEDTQEQASENDAETSENPVTAENAAASDEVLEDLAKPAPPLSITCRFCSMLNQLVGSHCSHCRRVVS